MASGSVNVGGKNYNAEILGIDELKLRFLARMVI